MGVGFPSPDLPTHGKQADLGHSAPDVTLRHDKRGKSPRKVQEQLGKANGEENNDVVYFP